MFGKCLICFVMCVVTCYASASGEESSSTQELTCLNYGGTCVRQGDCPDGNSARIQGLCPDGPKHRFVCCHGLPLSATGCDAQGGQCFETSYKCATLTDADDCAAGEHCCILIR